MREWCIDYLAAEGISTEEWGRVQHTVYGGIVAEKWHNKTPGDVAKHDAAFYYLLLNTENSEGQRRIKGGVSF